MEEGRGKYLEGMVQRAMEKDKYSGSRREFETQTKTDSGTQTVADYTQSRARTRPDAVGSESSGGIAGQAGSTNSSGRPAREKTSARQGKGNFLKGLISGTVISDSFILKDIRYSAMIVILAIVFIANRFNAERVEREITALEQEVRDLRAESLSVSADLGSVSRQSEISDLVKERGLGLEELREPPYRIVVNE